jgi:hypothetical protein
VTLVSLSGAAFAVRGGPASGGDDAVAHTSFVAATATPRPSRGHRWPGHHPHRTRTATTPATATRSTTPSPPAAGACRTQVWTNLTGCGRPGAGNTGAPDSGYARTVAGEYVVTKDGAVIDGWKVTGGIQVRAKNVVIRNSYVSNSAGGENGSGVVNVDPGASATLTHNTLDGRDATHACVWHEGTSLVAKANDCSGVNDGMFSWTTVEGRDGAGDNFTISDNWFHDLTTEAGNGHIDGYQTEGAKNGVIRHNTFDIDADQNSAVAIWNGRKSSSDISVDHNLIAGGGFSVYAEDYSPSEAAPAGGYSVTKIRLTDNVFSTTHFGCVGYWGVWFPRGRPTDGWNRSGNTVLETGQKIDDGNPTSKGQPCT